MRCRTRVPMMLRVRPAQLTMIVVSRSRFLAMSVMRSESSPPGTLRPPGMQKRRNSSGVRLSRMTNFSPFSMRSASSLASISGTWLTTSTFSPKSLLGTLLPHSVSKPSVTQRLIPPSSTDTRRYPSRSTEAAASCARRPSSSHSTTCVSVSGTAGLIESSSWRRAMRLAPGIWLLLYSPASLTSIRANGAAPSRRPFNACAAIFSAMVESLSLLLMRC